MKLIWLLEIHILNILLLSSEKSFLFDLILYLVDLLSVNQIFYKM